MKILHVVGKEMEEIKPEGEKYTFYDGDVYVVDKGQDIFIWLGKDSSTDEKTVGAWIANKLDNQDRGGEPSVMTVNQGEESEDFKSMFQYEVVDDDTPGFLKHAELDMVEYKLFRVFTKTETTETDETFVEEVPLERSSLKSDDVFVLDGNESLFIWIGSSANREEKYEGQKLLQKIDSGRNYLPLQYTIYEGEGGKSESGFYKFLEKAKAEGSALSVEDQREATYVPSEAQTADEHKAQTDKEFEDADPSDAPERVLTTADIPAEERDSLAVDKAKMEAEAEEARKAAEEAEAAAKKAEEERFAAEEAERQRIAEEEAKRKAEEEAKRKAEEEAARKAEEEAKRKAEEEAKRKAEEEAKRKAEEEAKRKAAEETQRRAEEAKRQAEEEAKKKAEMAKPASGVVKLFFIDGEFTHNPKDSTKAKAIIEVSMSSQKVTLTFPADAGLITRRTASRQAENVAKSGYLLDSGERIAVGFELEVVDADKLSEAHYRVGHEYNR